MQPSSGGAPGLLGLLGLLKLAVLTASVKVGVLLPMVHATLSGPRWPAWAKTILSIVCSIAAAAAVCYANGAITATSFDPANLAFSVAIVCLVAWNLWSYFWKPTGIAPWWESFTSALPAICAAMGGQAAAAYQRAQQLSAPAIAAASVPSPPSPSPLVAAAAAGSGPAADSAAGATAPPDTGPGDSDQPPAVSQQPQQQP